jgi:hypothetical protein
MHYFQGEADNSPNTKCTAHSIPARFHVVQKAASQAVEQRLGTAIAGSPVSKHKKILPLVGSGSRDY